MAYVETTSGANLSTAQAITTTADSTNVYDVTGAGVGNAPAMIGAGGVNTAMGIDIGAGDGSAIPEVMVSVTTTGTGAGTISITLSAAPDNGSYSAGTYVTLFTSAAFVGTTLTAGRQIIFQVPPIPPTLALPRFYKLTYTVSGSATASFTANLLLNAPLIRNATLQGNNFVAI